MIKKLIHYLGISNHDTREVAVLFNNLGGTSELEMSFIVAFSLQHLASLNYNVGRHHCRFYRTLYQRFLISGRKAVFGEVSHLIGHGRVLYIDHTNLRPTLLFDHLKDDLRASGRRSGSLCLVF